MSNELAKAIYYHDDTPEGRIFDMEEVSPETLAEQGWVDSPAKIGVDPWSGDPERFSELRQQVQDGEVPRIGGLLDVRGDDADKELVLKQNDKLLKEIEKQKQELETMKMKIKMKDEELQDMRSDASKLAAKPRKATRRSGNAEDKPVRGTKQKSPELTDDEKAELDAAAEIDADVEL